MSLRACWAISRAVLLESLRRFDIWVAGALSLLIMVAAGALGMFGMRGLEVFAKDLAVTVVGLSSTIVAVVVSARLVTDEVRRRSHYAMLARPIGALHVLIGKLIGAILATWIGLGLVSATTALALWVFEIPFDVLMAQYLVAKAMGLALLCSVTLALSLTMGKAAACVTSFVLAFGGSVISRGLVHAAATMDGGTIAVCGFLNSILPQFGLFDFGGRVANAGWDPVQGWVINGLAVYALIYMSAMMALSFVCFRRTPV